MKVTAITTKIFREGDDLVRFITTYLRSIQEASIIVVTSKIVALSESRTAVIENVLTEEKLIRSESELAIKTKYVWLTVKDGMVMASAGIDKSNANGKLILLPRNSFKTARILRRVLMRRYRLKHLGVLITDSRTVPLRAGVTGVCIGYAGLKGIRDYRGTPDLFGRKFKFSRTDVVDSLASAAVLMMGEGRERRPLALIENAPVEFREKIRRNELHIDIQDDMYRPLFQKLSGKK